MFSTVSVATLYIMVTITFASPGFSILEYNNLVGLFPQNHKDESDIIFKTHQSVHAYVHSS